jgi:hypothetical protein
MATFSFGVFIVNKSMNGRINNFTSEECLEECTQVEYITDISTTQLSKAFTAMHGLEQNDLQLSSINYSK